MTALERIKEIEVTINQHSKGLEDWVTVGCVKYIRRSIKRDKYLLKAFKVIREMILLDWFEDEFLKIFEERMSIQSCLCGGILEKTKNGFQCNRCTYSGERMKDV